jgi:hypothetical protein
MTLTIRILGRSRPTCGNPPHIYSLLNLIEQHIHEGLGLFCHSSMFPSIKSFLYSCHGVSDTKQIAADAKNSKKMPNINAKAC